MTTSHVFFIPLVLFVGVVIGLYLGRRSLSAEQAEEELLRSRREARREAAAGTDETS